MVHADLKITQARLFIQALASPFLPVRIQPSFQGSKSLALKILCSLVVSVCFLRKNLLCFPSWPQIYSDLSASAS